MIIIMHPPFLATGRSCLLGLKHAKWTFHLIRNTHSSTYSFQLALHRYTVFRYSILHMPGTPWSHFLTRHLVAAPSRTPVLRRCSATQLSSSVDSSFSEAPKKDRHHKHGPMIPKVKRQQAWQIEFIEAWKESFPANPLQLDFNLNSKKKTPTKIWS